MPTVVCPTPLLPLAGKVRIRRLIYWEIAIGMISSAEVKATIEAELQDAQVFVKDLTGGGDHYQLIVVSPQFAEKSLVQQHQLVYRSLKDAMATEAIHALTFKTYTPEAWEASGKVTVS